MKTYDTIPPHKFIVFGSPLALRVGKALNKSNSRKAFLSKCIDVLNLIDINHVICQIIILYMSSNKKSTSKNRTLKRSKQCRNCQKLILLDNYDDHVESCFRFRETPIVQPKSSNQGSNILQKTLTGKKKFQNSQETFLRPKLNDQNNKNIQETKGKGKIQIKRPTQKLIDPNKNFLPEVNKEPQILVKEEVQINKKIEGDGKFSDQKKQKMNQNFRVRPNSGIKRIETKEVKKKATNPVRVIETHNYLSNCYNNDPDRIGSIKKKEKNNNFHGIQHVEYLKQRKASLSSESQYYSQQMITVQNQKKEYVQNEEEDALDHNWNRYLKRQQNRQKEQIQRQQRRERQWLRQYQIKQKQRQEKIKRQIKQKERRERQVMMQIQLQRQEERQRQRERQRQIQQEQERQREFERARQRERDRQRETQRQRQRNQPQRSQRQQVEEQIRQQNYLPNIPILIENTNQIIDFIEGLPLLQDEGLMIMLNQLRQLNVIAHQIQELNLLGNNLGFRMGHIFANRIQELQTTIINQIGVTLVRGFHNQIGSQFEDLINQRPNLNIRLQLGFSKKQIQDIFPPKLSLKQTQCSICLQDMKRGTRIKQLQCEHVFHPNCIDQWLAGSRKCPLCRRVQAISTQS